MFFYDTISHHPAVLAVEFNLPDANTVFDTLLGCNDLSSLPLTLAEVNFAPKSGTTSTTPPPNLTEVVYIPNSGATTTPPPPNKQSILMIG